MNMNLGTRILILGILVLSVFSACTGPVGVVNNAAKGTVNFAFSASKTLDGNLNMAVVTYRLNLTGPGSSQTVDIAANGSAAVTKSLALDEGAWTVTADSLNSTNQIIDSGDASFTVYSGDSVDCTIVLARATGTGTVDLTVTWPAMVNSAGFSINLPALATPAQTVTLSSAVAGGPSVQANWTSTTLTAGYYDVVLQLSSAGTILWEKPDVLRVVANQTTRNTIALGMFDLYGLAVPEMIVVEGGTFSNGTSDSTVSSFFMSTREITQGQYIAVMGSNPSGYAIADAPVHPVANVSWYGALAYCNKLSLIEGKTPVYTINASTDPDLWDGTNDDVVNVPTASSTAWDQVAVSVTANGYRLPTEAEWQHAARGGVLSHNYTYAGGDSLDTLGWYYANSTISGVGAKSDHEVATLAANELGLYDMSGNVWEWCFDWYGDYSSFATTDYSGPASGTNRILRGGAWCTDATYCTVAYRNSSLPSATNSTTGAGATAVGNTGFRVVCSTTLTSLTLNSETLDLVIGGSGATLTASYLPLTAGPSLVWNNSNPGVASFDESTGLITALATGTTTISVSALGFTDSCTVTVYNNLSSATVGDMLVVPGGSFSNGTANVTVSTFWMGKYEVTQEQYLAVMGSNPAMFTLVNGYTDNITRPVEQVSWYDALVFCNKLSILEGKTPVYTINGYTDPDLWDGVSDSIVAVPAVAASMWDGVTMNINANGYRLPTEAEWEFAARGGKATHGYVYAGSNTPADVAWYYDNSSSTPQSVGLKAANELGLYDMTGNIREWCWDWVGDYSTEVQGDPTGPATGINREVRGGCFSDLSTDFSVSFRNGGDHPGRSMYTGFRIVCRNEMDLATALANLQSNWTNLAGTITSRYSLVFSGSNNITDGGADQYDSGNYIVSSLASTTPLAYTGGSMVNTGTAGASIDYFTLAQDGMFAFAAQMTGAAWIKIYGNLGADGSGSFAYTSTPIAGYTAYFYQAYGSGDGTVNHVVLVPSGISGSVTQTWTITTTQDYDHTITGFPASSRVYFLLFSRTASTVTTADEFAAIARNFATALTMASGL